MDFVESGLKVVTVIWFILGVMIFWVKRGTTPSVMFSERRRNVTCLYFSRLRRKDST